MALVSMSYLELNTLFSDSQVACRAVDAGCSINPFPTLVPYRGLGSGMLQLSPLRVPGTDLKVGTECKGHGEVLTGRWWSELHIIHTN